MIFYHTSPAPIHYVDGELEFKRVYEPAYMGLHAWAEHDIANKRISSSETNDFLYEFEYPVDSVEELTVVAQCSLQIGEEKPSEIAVKVKEDSGPGKSKYHIVIFDYSKIIDWRELYANQNSKYLTGELDKLTANNPSREELSTNTEMETLKDLRQTKKYLGYLGWAVALSLVAWFDYTIER
jgi:hypothetical protein